jgi:hypothetical protein
MKVLRGVEADLTDKIDVVKGILISLSRSLQRCEQEELKRLRYKRLDPSEFYSRKVVAALVKTVSLHVEALSPADDAECEQV